MLKISTRVRYGTRALVQIAESYPNRAASIKEVGRLQRVSSKYLEQIFIGLKAGGLVRSVRGKKGGYTLARPPESIRLSEIVRVVEGPPVIVECVDDPSACPFRRQAGCATRAVWVKIRKAVNEILEGTTLKDLLDGHRPKARPTP